MQHPVFHDISRFLRRGFPEPSARPADVSGPETQFALTPARCSTATGGRSAVCPRGLNRNARRNRQRRELKDLTGTVTVTAQY
jgi:hypothetical protein